MVEQHGEITDKKRGNERNIEALPVFSSLGIVRADYEDLGEMKQGSHP